MAHFASLDANNIVTYVCVVDNANCDNLPFPDSEPIGQEYLASLGLEGRWIETSYNTYIDVDGKSQHRFGGTPVRGCYATLDATYNEASDVFIPLGWTYNSKTKVYTRVES